MTSSNWANRPPLLHPQIIQLIGGRLKRASTNQLERGQGSQWTESWKHEEHGFPQNRLTSVIVGSCCISCLCFWNWIAPEILLSIMRVFALTSTCLGEMVSELMNTLMRIVLSFADNPQWWMFWVSKNQKQSLLPILMVLKPLQVSQGLVKILEFCNTRLWLG